MNSKTQQSNSGDYVRLDDLPSSPAIPNASSAHFAAKRYRGPLVAAGALIPGKGRSPSLAHRDRFAAVVLEERRREAQEHQADKIIAGRQVPATEPA